MTPQVFISGMHIADDGTLVVHADEIEYVVTNRQRLIPESELGLANARIEELTAQLAEYDHACKTLGIQKDVLAYIDGLKTSYEMALEVAEARAEAAEKQSATLKVQLSEEYRDWMKEQCNEECRYGERLYAEVKAKAERLSEIVTEHDGIECTKHDVLVRTAVEERKKAEADAERLRGVAEELKSSLEYALRATGCDGDLCTEDWHEDARKVLALTESALSPAEQADDEKGEE